MVFRESGLGWRPAPRENSEDVASDPGWGPHGRTRGYSSVTARLDKNAHSGRIQKELPVASQGRNGASKFAQAPLSELRGRSFSGRAKPRPGATSKALRRACWRAGRPAPASPHPRAAAARAGPRGARPSRGLMEPGRSWREGVGHLGLFQHPRPRDGAAGPWLGRAAGGYLAPPASQAAVESRSDLPGHSLPGSLPQESLHPELQPAPPNKSWPAGRAQRSQPWTARMCGSNALARGLAGGC